MCALSKSKYMDEKEKSEEAINENKIIKQKVFT